MFTQAVTNTKLKTQQTLKKKKHVNVCFALDAYVKKQWKHITRKDIKPEKDLFSTEHIDVVQTTLVELKAVEEERLKERDRKHFRLMARIGLLGLRMVSGIMVKDRTQG